MAGLFTNLFKGKAWAINIYMVAVFVMLAILCANVAQIKKTVRKIHNELRKNNVSMNFPESKI